MGKPKALAVLPAVLLAVTITIVIAFDLFSGSISNPPLLLLVLNIIFITGANIAVSILSARSYLKTRSSNLLALGCSLLFSGIAALAAGLASLFSANLNVTIFNIGIFAAAAVQVLAAFLTFSGNPTLKFTSRKTLLIVAYSVVVALMLLFSAMAADGLFPVFFTTAGPTLIRQTVLGFAALLFALAFFVYLGVYLKSKSTVLLLYFLGLITVSTGLFGSLFVTQFTGVLAWLTRLGQYVGGLYFLAAIVYLGSIREIGIDFSGAWTEAFRSDQRQLETLFSKMLNAFSYHRVIVDDEGKPVDYVFLATNEAFEKMTGLNRESVIGRRVTEVLPEIEKDPVKWINIYGKVALTGEPVTFENYAATLKRWYSVSSYSPRKGHFVAIFEDITKRKKAEEALKKLNEELEERVRERTNQVSSERQRLYSILETLPAYVVLLDKDYHIHFANKVFRERFGESHGRRCFEFMFERDSPCENCETYKVLKTNSPINWEWKGPDGYYYEVFDFPFVEADSSLLILEMGIDITDRKKAEEAARESTKKLKDAERLATIGATAGMVGHDIRNPLQAITSDIYLIKSDLASIPEVEEKENMKESLFEIEKNIAYINKIVQDLQDYARPISLVPREIDLENLCENVLFKNGLPDNIEATCRVKKEAKKTVADSDVLQRILSNLVVNAVQAMPEGGKLALDVSKETDCVVISVEDTGVGIPDDVKTRLFTPLFTTKSKGQGFGLAVVKRLVDTLSGTVTFESEVGKGTRFKVYLPSQNGDKPEA